MIHLVLFSVLNASAGSSAFLTDLENFKNKNLSLQSEKQNLQAAEDLLMARRLFWTPKLSVSANETRSKLNSDDTIKGNYLEADASLNIFRGGSDWHTMQEASGQKKSQELGVLNESLRIEIKAADLIFKALYLQEVQRIQQQLLKMKEESFNIVSNRYQQGKLPLQEVTKSQVDLIQQKNKMRLSQLDLAENKSQMASFFVTKVETTDWPFGEKTVAKELSRDNKIPIVEQKYWLAKAREQNWKSIKGLHWPTVDLLVQYKTTPISDRTTNQWAGTLSLTLPIWNSFETSSRVSSAYAQFVGASNDYKETEQSLQQKEFFLKEKIEIARVNLAEAKKNLATSRQLYQDILKSFRLGRMSTNDLFLDQNRLLESETALAASQLTFHQSLIENCALVGLTAATCLN